MDNCWTDSMLRSFESTFCTGCLVGVPGGGGGIGERWCRVGRGLGVAVNSRHAIRERPHVCTISGIRRERGRRGVVAACGSYENCSVETVTATLHNLLSHNHALSVTLTISFPLFLSYIHKTLPKTKVTWV